MPDLGYWGSATIVLFSDGEDERQRATRPRAAATAAQTAGVHIETVGVGTTAGTTVEVDGYRIQTALDADTLTAIAKTTGGSYHPASDAAATRRHRLDHQPAADHAQRGRCRWPARSPRSRSLLLARRRDPHRPAHGKDRLMTFAWPWALLALLAIPLVLGHRLVVAAPAAAGRRAGDLGRAGAQRPARAGRSWRRRIPAALLRARPGRARRRRGPSAGDRAGVVQLDDDHAGPGRVGLDVFDRRRSRTGSPRPRRRRPPSSRRSRTARGSAWSPSPGSRPELVPPTTDTSKLLAAMKNLTDLARHRHRPGDPDLDRRDRRGRSVGGADRGQGRRRHRVGVRGRHHRAAHRRRQHPGRRPADRGAAGGRAPRAGLHDRLRHHHADADGLRPVAGRGGSGGGSAAAAASASAAAAAASTR